MERLEALFPRLRGTAYRIISSASEVYNCIAWAASDTDPWWWPGDPARTHWPLGTPRLERLAAFRDAFATLSYAVREHAELEPGFEKSPCLPMRTERRRMQPGNSATVRGRVN